MERWTAVVRGAVIYGIEKTRNNKLTTMTATQHSYGIPLAEAFSEINHNPDQITIINPLTQTRMAVGRMRWLIKKGDVILSSKPRVVSQVFDYSFVENGKRNGDIPIYSYDEDDMPEEFERARGGKYS